MCRTVTPMSHSFMRSHRLIHVRQVLLTIAALLVLAPPVEAQNEALLRLLQVLRDRGSITAQEYEEIRKVADAPQTPAPAGRIGALETRVAEQEKTVAAIKAQTDGNRLGRQPRARRQMVPAWSARVFRSFVLLT